jgi:murein DD-endopeptidase MepM/ murein hydrolase activator NlpD
MVKRNDEVRRGQIIAKSGQSGSVTSPQLHFEIRKGSAPVDPAQYLPSGA